MKTEEIKSIKIELDGDEAEKFKSVIKKVTDESNRIGFNSDLTSEEKNVIKELNSKLNG